MIGFGLRPVAVAIAWLVWLAAAGTWFVERRPRAAELRAGTRFLVTSPKDSGPGSLREAIFAADRVAARAGIDVRAGRIVLESALPPLVNTQGVVIESSDSTEIDARALPEGAALEVMAPRSVVQGVRVRGAAGRGIQVRAAGVLLRGVTLSDCGDGVSIIEGADSVLVEDSSFEANGAGVRIAPGAVGSVVRRNRFRRHDQAAVWAVAAAPPLAASSSSVDVTENDFEADRISVVLMNVPGRVEANRFSGAGEVGIYLTGPGVLRGNRVERGASTGIYADASRGTVIEKNEISDNAASGLLLRGTHEAQVRDNRIYRNGYGIVVVFGDPGSPTLADNLVMNQRLDGVFLIGASPSMRGNRSLTNRAAGLRALDYVPRLGRRIAAEPRLDGNVLQGNGTDAPVHGEYREPREAREGP